MDKQEFSKDFKLECDCGCGMLIVNKWNYDEKHPDEDDGFLSYWEAGFYTEQKPFRRHLRESLKIIWSILRGKRYCFYEVIIPKKQWDDFKKFIAST